MNTSQTSTQSWGPRLLLLGLTLLAGWGWGFSAHGNDVFTPDRPLQCFTNLADPLLHITYGDELSITNIPLYPTNRYTPGVHRLLQLAANLNDACTSTVYPSVFRPVFRRDESGVSIAGYEWVTNNWKMVFDYPCVEVEELATNTALNLEQVNVYNVPWVVGAKRGFPNFNQLFLQTALTASRKLE
ncbi:MAG TPA: hypothetical protein VL527_13010, partial [Dongiaceae bacterium]|nr:hypothetical protein [Dongiaceae bacterium]